MEQRETGRSACGTMAGAKLAKEGVRNRVPGARPADCYGRITWNPGHGLGGSLDGLGPT